jgi:hypothetical protein
VEAKKVAGRQERQERIKSQKIAKEDIKFPFHVELVQLFQ